MNRAYRLIWSEAQQAFVAAAEFARARGKRGGAVLLLSAAFLAVPPGPVFAANLPQGGQIVAGTGSIAQSGNTLTVTQGSDKFAANWQSFSIGQGHTVQFVQPSSSAVAMNRVLGSDVSVIQGALKANGQVYLINPNGVLFTPTAQVNVGGLIASTQNLSSEDFLAGRLRFSGHSTAAIRNEGQITAAPGGTVALIAAKIENTGSIAAPQGNVLLGAGKAVTLDLGGPVKIQVEEGALEALIDQGGAIRADGGYVYLTAQAAGDLASAAINHTGITEAKTLATGEKGEIWLMGDMTQGQVNVAGTLDASAPTSGDGGFIETSAAKVKVADGAQVKAGHWLIDPTDYHIGGATPDITGATLSSNLATSDITIATSASGSGNGDIFVRDNVTWTSGHILTLSAHRNIEILATLDASGDAGGKVALKFGQGNASGIIDGKAATYSFGLTGSGFTGKINLQAGPNFSTQLGSDAPPVEYIVITALGNVESSNDGSLQGMRGNLSENYALGANINAGGTSTWDSDGPDVYYGFAPIGNQGTPFTGRFDGLGHTITNLTINRPDTDYVGLFGSADSAHIANVGLVGGSLAGHSEVGALVGYKQNGVIIQSYATGNVSGRDYDVGGLVGWNEGGTISQSYATGSVEGIDYVGGLVGWNDSGTISQSYATARVSGSRILGGLVAGNDSGNIIQSYATGNVSGTDNTVGGLVGYNWDGSIEQSYATGDVTGGNKVGGLVGRNYNNGTIEQSYATGSVTGSDSVGGLVGYKDNGSIIQSYATGAVTGMGPSPANLGGLVGSDNSGTISASFYAITDASGNTINNGGETDGAWSGNNHGINHTLANLKKESLFGESFWDIDDEGGTSRVWRIYDRDTLPLLRWALRPLTITSAVDGGKTYDGTTVTSLPAGLFAFSPSPHDASKLLLGGSLSGQKNADSYTARVYSTQNGYDLIDTRSVNYDIAPRPVTVTADAKSKTVGQSDPPLTYAIGCPTGLSTDCGLVTGETLAGSLSRDAGEAVGAYTIRQDTVTDANNPNYAIAFVGNNLTISAASSGGGSSSGGSGDTGTGTGTGTGGARTDTGTGGTGTGSTGTGVSSGTDTGTGTGTGSGTGSGTGAGGTGTGTGGASGSPGDTGSALRNAIAYVQSQGSRNPQSADPLEFSSGGMTIFAYLGDLPIRVVPPGIRLPEGILSEGEERR